MSAHPCPSCGWTLRWDQTQWACDRCGTRLPPQPAAPQQSGLAHGGWQQAVSTNPGIAPAGGSFGGSAASSSPIVRSPSQPPGVYSAPAQQRPQSASQPNYAFGQAPPGQAQPPNPYGNAGFGGSATAAAPPQAQAHGPSQFGAAYPAPQPGGFGGSATAAQPQATRPHAPSNGPAYRDPRAQAGYVQPELHAQAQSGAPPSGVDLRAPSTPGYGPGGYPSYTPPASANDLAPAAKKSKRGLVIAIGAVVAIGAGIAIAVAVSQGGGTKKGLGSPDEVASETLTALAAGDVDRLVTLISPELEADFISCDEEGKTKRDPGKALTALRENLTKIVGSAKGLSVELVKLGTAKTTRMEKGKELTKGCTLTSDFAMHEHDLTVKLKSGSRAAQERTVKITFAEADGRWFLSNAPTIERPGDCAVATKAMIASNKAEFDKSKLGDAARLRIEGAVLQHCKEDAWADAVVTCFEDATISKTCAKQLTTAQVEKLDKHMTAIISDDVRSREVPTIAETPTPAVDPTIDPTKAPDAGAAVGSGSGSGSGSAVAEVSDQLPPICADYKAEIDKLGSCRRMKADMKKAQRQGYEMIVEGWNRITKKTELQYASFENICKRGVEALVDLRKTLCR